MSIEISIAAPKNLKNFNLGIVEGSKTLNNLDELAQIVTNFHWTPGIFSSETRSIKTCIGAQLLAFDIDEGCSLDQALKLFQDYKHVIVTSRSHQKEKITKTGKIKPPVDRFRLILFPDRTIKDDLEFKTTWLKMSEDYPFFDESCKDISRLYYAGDEIVSVQEEGRKITVLEYTAPQKESGGSGALRIKGRLSNDTKEFLINLSDPGTRHNKMIKALFDFREQGYTKDDAYKQFERAYEVNDDEWSSDQEKRIEDVYEKREVRHSARWPATKKTRDGVVPDPKVHANYAFLFESMGYTFYKNEMDSQIYLDKKCTKQLDDDVLGELSIKAMEEGLRDNREIIYRACNKIAMSQAIHPLKAAIEGVTQYNPKTDIDYIGRLIKTLEFRTDPYSEESEFDQIARYQSYLERWFIGCAAKLYRPGSQNLTLVFQGAQGIGKSRWLSKLALWKGAFGEGSVDPGNKDHDLRHLDNFIWHIPELESVTSKRESGALKDYLTKDMIQVRPAYARTTRKGHSVCSFCASVNVEAFLTDWTGNRRFLVIPLKSMNADHNVNIATVFNQAKYLLEKKGTIWWLTGPEIKELNDASERFTMESPINYIVERIKPGEDFMSSHELFEWFEHRATPTDFSRLNVLLAKRGFKHVTNRIDNIKKRGYLVNKSELGQ